MKKIFLSIVIIISLRGLSQDNSFPINATNGSPTTGVLTKGRLSIDSLLQINRTCFNDTLKANAGNIDRIPGAIIRLCNNSLMIRSNDATQWIGLGGAGTISSINFYSDSSLIICYGNGVCDTISFSNTVNNSITNIYNNSIVNIFLNGDSTCIIRQTGGGINVDTTCFGFTICSFGAIDNCTLYACSCPDSLGNTTCDTITVTCLPFYLKQNWVGEPSVGLTEFGSRSNTASPGYFLNHDTYANTGYWKMNFLGYRVYDYPYVFTQQQSWQNGSGMLSILSPGNKNYNHLNTVRLGFNFTDDTLHRSPFIAGVFENKIGYWLGTNLTINGSFGLNQDDNTSKNTGIFFDTKTSGTNGVSIYAQAAQGGTYVSTLANSIVANFNTNGRVAFPQYVNIADAATDSALYIGANGQIMKGKVNTGTTTPAGNYGNVQLNRNNLFATPASDSFTLNSARLTLLGHQTITSANATGTTTSAGLVLNANSLTVGTGLYAASSTLSSGSLVDLSVSGTASTGSTQKALNVLTTGTNATSNILSYGIYSANTHDGTTSRNYGILGTSSGGTGLNYGVVGSATGTNSYAVVGTGGDRGVYGTGTDGIYGVGSSRGVYGESNFTGVFGTTTNGGAAGTGVLGTTNGVDGQVAVYGFANTGGLPLQGQSTVAATNSVRTILQLNRRVSGGGGSAAAGIGTSLDFYSDDDNSGSNDLTLANQIISKWTNATHATRTSLYTVKGVINTTTNDLLRMGDFVTLTESSATTFVSTTVGENKIAGGEIIVTVTANDASDIQSRTLRFIWTAVNDAGTLTITIGTPEEAVAVSGGTLTAAITGVDAGSGVLNFQANAVSSLAQTTLRCSYTFIQNF